MLVEPTAGLSHDHCQEIPGSHAAAGTTIYAPSALNAAPADFAPACLGNAETEPFVRPIS